MVVNFENNNTKKLMNSPPRPQNAIIHPPNAARIAKSVEQEEVSSGGRYHIYDGAR